MTRRFFVFARVALILLLAGFTGPTAAGASDGFVICGADGVKRFVAFDFAAGAPAEPAATFHECDHCVAPPHFPPPASFAADARIAVVVTTLIVNAHQAPQTRVNPRNARAPPISPKDRT